MSGRHNGCPALMTIAAAPFCAMAGFPAFSNLPLPMSGLLSDPWFYAAAIPAVILVGLSKGGFGGAVGFVGVPLMALISTLRDGGRTDCRPWRSGRSS